MTLKPIEVQRPLLGWYARHRRDLPWRRTRDPYAVWVSEIMLQQTQVATVVPYYRRFLRRFPTVRSLARAPLDDVLKAWEGLGYYSRCRNLHRAAQKVLSDWGGRLPDTSDELLKLPGIGRYTAGAISSIAFNRDEPVLDGNVARVLCRLFRIRRNPRESAAQRQLWDLARRLLPLRKAGLFNQALMDLGAMVCVPRSPRCQVCPLRRACLARLHGDQDRLPATRRRRPLPHHDIAAGIVWRGRRILIDRRTPDGLLGGLWEFPGGKREQGESLESCLRREVKEETGVSARVQRPFMSVGHSYSHFRITLHVFECRHLSGRAQALQCSEVKWVRPDELDRYAFPAANRKVIAALREKAAIITQLSACGNRGSAAAGSRDGHGLSGRHRPERPRPQQGAFPAYRTRGW